jgi:hypothetical protein
MLRSAIEIAAMLRQALRVLPATAELDPALRVMKTSFYRAGSWTQQSLREEEAMAQWVDSHVDDITLSTSPSKPVAYRMSGV